MPKRQLAIVTGASAGIGYELAELCAADGFDLVIAADEPSIETAAKRLESHGGKVDWVECDLATEEGVEEVLDAVGRRQVDVLMANAGHGLGDAFLDQEFEDILHVIDTNITGTLFLVHRVGQRMRKRGSGRILITGSIAGFIPGAYQAVYNASKAFLDSFSFALRAELAESGVTVTCLMPGATETEFFDRAGLTDTKIGQEKKDDPKDVAKSGFDALMRGDGDVVTGWQNKLQTAIASVTPAAMLARQHARKAAPGTGETS